MLKDEQNRSYNGGGDAKLLKTWSDFSSLRTVRTHYILLKHETLTKVFNWYSLRHADIFAKSAFRNNLIFKRSAYVPVVLSKAFVTIESYF